MCRATFGATIWGAEIWGAGAAICGAGTGAATCGAAGAPPPGPRFCCAATIVVSEGKPKTSMARTPALVGRMIGTPSRHGPHAGLHRLGPEAAQLDASQFGVRRFV